MDSQHATLYDPSRSLAPPSSVADSNDEVDRLLTVSTTPARSPANYNSDGESELSSLTSSDEEGEDINATPRPLRSERMLRPRITKALIPTVEHATASPAMISLPSPPATVDQPSKKRKHTESITAQTTSTTREQKPKPGPFVSEERCHQCRNFPRYAFMRCTENGASGQPCRKLFCASCIIKRYPGDIDFNPKVKKWKCPFCKDLCDCTKCCFKRNVPYTSTSGVKIEHDLLLHYAALMPGNSNSEKPPHPPKSLKLVINPKLLQKPTPRLIQDRAAAKTERVRKVRQNADGARDIESIIRSLADTAAMFEKFGCASGEYWGVVFSHIDGGRIGVAYVGDQLPDIFIRRDEGNEGPLEVPSTPPTKRRRVSSRISA